MNVLKLYKFENATTSEKQSVPPPRKRKHSVDRLSSGISVSYFCANCGKEIVLQTSEPVSCYSCHHRVLEKKREKKGIKYAAV